MNEIAVNLPNRMWARPGLFFHETSPPSCGCDACETGHRP